MQNNRNPLPPFQVGTDAETSERLVKEIENTGVVQSQDAAESAPARDENISENISEDEEPSSIPMPVVTRG